MDFLARRGGIFKYIPIMMTTFLWGSMNVPSYYAVLEFPPMLLVILRSSVSLIIISAARMLMRRPLLPARCDALTVFMLGFFGVFVNNYLGLTAFKLTSMTNIAIIFASSPMMTAVMAAMFLGERMRQSRIVGVLLAFFSVTALITGGRLSELLNMSFNPGDLCQLGTSFTASLLSVLGKRVKKTSADLVVMWQMITGVTCGIAVICLTGGNPLQMLSESLASASTRAVLSMLYIGSFCSCLAYIMQQTSARLIGAAASGAFLNAMPPIAVITASLVMGERISSLQFICMGAIFLGVWLNTANFDIIGRKGRQSV